MSIVRPPCFRAPSVTNNHEQSSSLFGQLAGHYMSTCA